MNVKRSFYYDNLKALLILLVVVDHFNALSDCQFNFSYFVDSFIVSFHMPLFIFISGLFHKNSDLINRLARLLICFLIFNISNAILLGTNPITQISGAPWYLLALILYNVITYLIKNIKPYLIIAVAVALGMATLFDSMIGNMEYGCRIINWYIFYYLGSIADKKRIEQLFNNIKVKLFGALALIFTLIIMYKLRNTFLNYNEIINVRLYPRDDYRDKIGGVVWVMSFFVTIANSFGVMALVPHKEMKIITRIGSRTIQIYYWHYIFRNFLFCTGLKKVFTYLNRFDLSGGFIICWGLSIIIMYVFSLEIFAFPLNIKFFKNIKE